MLGLTSIASSLRISRSHNVRLLAFTSTKTKKTLSNNITHCRNISINRGNSKLASNPIVSIIGPPNNKSDDTPLLINNNFKFCNTLSKHHLRDNNLSEISFKNIIELNTQEKKQNLERQVARYLMLCKRYRIDENIAINNVQKILDQIYISNMPNNPEGIFIKFESEMDCSKLWMERGLSKILPHKEKTKTAFSLFQTDEGLSAENAKKIWSHKAFAILQSNPIILSPNIESATKREIYLSNFSRASNETKESSHSAETSASNEEFDAYMEGIFSSVQETQANAEMAKTTALILKVPEKITQERRTVRTIGGKNPDIPDTSATFRTDPRITSELDATKKFIFIPKPGIKKQSQNKYLTENTLFKERHRNYLFTNLGPAREEIQAYTELCMELELLTFPKNVARIKKELLEKYNNKDNRFPSPAQKLELLIQKNDSLVAIIKNLKKNSRIETKIVLNFRPDLYTVEESADPTTRDIANGLSIKSTSLPITSTSLPVENISKKMDEKLYQKEIEKFLILDDSLFQIVPEEATLIMHKISIIVSDHVTHIKDAGEKRLAFAIHRNVYLNTELQKILTEKIHAIDSKLSGNNPQFSKIGEMSTSPTAA